MSININWDFIFSRHGVVVEFELIGEVIDTENKKINEIKAIAWITSLKENNKLNQLRGSGAYNTEYFKCYTRIKCNINDKVYFNNKEYIIDGMTIQEPNEYSPVYMYVLRTEDIQNTKGVLNVNEY